MSVFNVRLCPSEGIVDGLRVLCGEQHPQNLTPILIMLEDLLPDQLAFTVAISGKPNALGGLQRVVDCLELGRLVAAARRAGAVKSIRTQQNGCPLLPCRDNVARLEQIEEMALGREDRPITRSNSGTDPLPGWLFP